MCQANGLIPSLQLPQNPHSHTLALHGRLPDEAVPRVLDIFPAARLEELELKAAEDRREHEVQLCVSKALMRVSWICRGTGRPWIDVLDADTHAGSASERHEEAVCALGVGVAVEPAVGIEGAGVGEDGRVHQDRGGRHAHWSLPTLLAVLFLRDEPSARFGETIAKRRELWEYSLRQESPSLCTREACSGT